MSRGNATEGLTTAINALNESTEKLKKLIGYKKSKNLDSSQEAYEVDKNNSRLIRLKRRQVLLQNANDNNILDAPTIDEIQTIKDFIKSVQDLTLAVALTNSGFKLIVGLASQGFGLGAGVELDEETSE